MFYYRIRCLRLVLFNTRSKNTPYKGGQYLGKLIFPENYPYEPPALQMITPSGRFKTNEDICMSFTNYHTESWNPLWTIGAILVGFVSFMVSDELTTGIILYSNEEKIKNFAKESKDFNQRNDIFKTVFPHLVNNQQGGGQKMNALLLYLYKAKAMGAKK